MHRGDFGWGSVCVLLTGFVCRYLLVLSVFPCYFRVSLPAVSLSVLTPLLLSVLTNRSCPYLLFHSVLTYCFSLSLSLLLSVLIIGSLCPYHCRCLSLTNRSCPYLLLLSPYPMSRRSLTSGITTAYMEYRWF